MKRDFPDLPTWEFEIDEVSAGVYAVTGRARAGHCVSAKGIDPDSLLEQCRNEAMRISMTGPLAECEIALSNIRQSINSDRRFPQNVFTGEWNEFRFFDSDWVTAADFVEHLKEFLSAENGRCAAVVNLDIASDDRARSSLLVHKDTTPNEYQSLLGNPGVGTGWLVDLGRLACASNTGEWSMYCEPAAEIAVIGFRQTLSQGYRQVLARFHAACFADAIKEPALSYGFSPQALSSTWRDEFLREYAPR